MRDTSAASIHPGASHPSKTDKELVASGTRGGVELIPKLHPLCLWPRRHAKVAEAFLALERIDYIALDRVKKVHGSYVFVMSVYLKRNQSRIPTNRLSRAGSITSYDCEERESITADYTMEKTTQELQALRYHTWVYAQCSKRNACSYCAAFDKFTNSTYSHTKLLTLMWPSLSHQRKRVEGFLNDLITLCVESLVHRPRNRSCQGFDNIPVRVERFLKRQYVIDRL